MTFDVGRLSDRKRPWLKNISIPQNLSGFWKNTAMLQLDVFSLGGCIIHFSLAAVAVSNSMGLLLQLRCSHKGGTWAILTSNLGNWSNLPKHIWISGYIWGCMYIYNYIYIIIFIYIYIIYIYESGLRIPGPPPPQWYGPQAHALGNTGHGTIHTCMHACMHPCIHPSIHTGRHTYRHTHRQTDIPIYLPTYIPTYLRTYVPTYTRTYTRTYAHTAWESWVIYTCKYVYIYIHSISAVLGPCEKVSPPWTQPHLATRCQFFARPISSRATARPRWSAAVYFVIVNCSRCYSNASKGDTLRVHQSKDCALPKESGF